MEYPNPNGHANTFQGTTIRFRCTGSSLVFGILHVQLRLQQNDVWAVVTMPVKMGINAMLE